MPYGLGDTRSKLWLASTLCQEIVLSTVVIKIPRDRRDYSLFRNCEKEGRNIAQLETTIQEPKYME